MKLKQGYILREVGTLKVVVAVGQAHDNFHKILTLNQTGAFLWNLLLNQTTVDELVLKLCEKYNVDEQSAKKDVEDFISQLNANALLDN
jgi:hypothetical protein